MADEQERDDGGMGTEADAREFVAQSTFVDADRANNAAASSLSKFVRDIMDAKRILGGRGDPSSVLSAARDRSAAP